MIKLYLILQVVNDPKGILLREIPEETMEIHLKFMILKIG